MGSSLPFLKFVCLNYASTFQRGKLPLPWSFDMEYGSKIPDKVKLHVPSGLVWEGRIVQGSGYIEGLEEMMDFYGLKPYHLCILDYTAFGIFKIKIFTPYTVESNYKRSDNSGNINEIEISKLFSSYRYSVICNFSGLCKLVIEDRHFTSASYIKIFSREDWLKMHFTEVLTEIQLVLKKLSWTVELKWHNGELYFGKGWGVFLQQTSTVVGDELIFEEIPGFPQLKISYIERSAPTVEDFEESFSQPCFFKIINRKCLDLGQFEVPYVFVKRFGHLISGKVLFYLPGGRRCKLRYSVVDHKITGIVRFFLDYHLCINYLVFFEYTGSSQFSVSVYDSEQQDHFRNIDGSFNYDKFDEVAPTLDFIDLTFYSGYSVDGEEGQEVNSVFQSIEGEALSEPLDDTIGIEHPVALPNSVFEVEIKPSHLDRNYHGCYLGKSMWSVYQNWGRHTTINLILDDEEWYVEAIRNKRSCRFSKGWDAFAAENNFQVGQKLSFQYIGQYIFAVSILS